MKRRILAFILALLTGMLLFTQVVYAGKREPENGVYTVGGVQKYYENGKFTDRTGLAKRKTDGKWVYVRNGVFRKATGLVKKIQDDGKRYYVKNGVFRKYTGKAKAAVKGNSRFYTEKGVSRFRDCGANGRLYINSLGISVAYHAGHDLTAITDAPDSAALFSGNQTRILADHNNQGFANLPQVSIGTKALLKTNKKTVALHCIGTDRNARNTGLWLYDGTGRDVDETFGHHVYIMYTCLKDWQHIFVSWWAV